MGKTKATFQPEPPEPEMITIYGDIIQETDNAVLLTCEGKGYWLPKSQIEYSGERGETQVEVMLPEWLADEKGVDDRQGFKISEQEICSENIEEKYLPPDQHWLNQETITVTQELSQKEKAEFADEMAKLDDEIESLEHERDSISKSLKKQIDAKEEERRKLSKIVREGNEEREIFCDKLADYNACDIVWADAHVPHAEVKRRKMTSEERQLPIKIQDKPKSLQEETILTNPEQEVVENIELIPDAQIEITEPEMTELVEADNQNIEDLPGTFNKPVLEFTIAAGATQ